MKPKHFVCKLGRKKSEMAKVTQFTLGFNWYIVDLNFFRHISNNILYYYIMRFAIKLFL